MIKCEGTGYFCSHSYPCYIILSLSGLLRASYLVLIRVRGSEFNCRSFGVDFIPSCRKYTCLCKPFAQCFWKLRTNTFLGVHECCDAGEFQQGALHRHYQHDPVDSVSWKRAEASFIHSFIHTVSVRDLSLQPFQWLWGVSSWFSDQNDQLRLVVSQEEWWKWRRVDLFPRQFFLNSKDFQVF